jgi:hypothetical protein
MRTAVQIVFNGHGDTVVGDLDRALRHVELNLNDGRELEGFSQAYPMLHAADVQIGLAYRLAKLASYEGRESIELVTHNLDAAPNHHSDVSNYDLCDTRDPAALVAMALLKAEDTDTDLADIEEQLAQDVRDVVENWNPGEGNADRLIDGFRNLQNAFGTGTYAVAQIDWNSIDLASVRTEDDLAQAVADAAVTAFDRAATLAFTDEAAPKP